MTSPLTKSRIVMAFLWLADEHAIFSYEGYAEDDPQFLRLSGQAWKDMGEPRAITVTIQPGDLLN